MFDTWKSHKLYLRYVTGPLVAVFGPALTLATRGGAAARPAELGLDLLALESRNVFTEPTTRFLAALSGGFLTGFGVLLVCLFRCSQAVQAC